MEGGKSKSKSSGKEGTLLRKGPWKPEEDQVLINHVKLYGPRDWSSIRSKGLLHRTGKSCRLRWVNKLRPNLKNGCKFTAEEERVVIELQAQLGNKWATIATHLPGRTDNDVKNFWSSRQKRLARLLHSQSPSFPKSNSTLSPQAPKSSCLMEGETSSKRQKSFSSSSPHTGHTSSNNTCMKKIVHQSSASVLDSETNNDIPEAIPLQQQQGMGMGMGFPSIPHLQTDQLPFPLETQELIDRLDSSFFGGPFGCTDEPPLLLPCFDDHNPIAPDSFFDDFPSDMFDEIEPLPSPSAGW